MLGPNPRGRVFQSTLVALATLAAPSLASAFTATRFDVPGATGTVARGINNFGEIVGDFVDGTGTHGFLRSSTVACPPGQSPPCITVIVFPGASVSHARGINDAGDIVGDFQAPDGRLRGYLFSKGTFQLFDAPGAHDTLATGINNAHPAQISGQFVDNSTFQLHGFLLTGPPGGGAFTTINHPDTSLTSVHGLNDAGQLVGAFQGAPPDPQTPPRNFAFVTGGGGAGFTTIDPPNALVGSEANGINAAGQVVGFVQTGQGNTGFLYDGGAYTEIRISGGFFTSANGINDAGQISGFFIDVTGTHGFVGGDECTKPTTGSTTVSPNGIVEGLNCGHTGSDSPLRSWLDVQSNRFDVFCQSPRAPFPPEFALKYNGRRVGRCPWLNGRNTGQIFHGGETGNGDGKFKCFIQSFWRSLEPGFSQGVPGTADWKTYTFNPKTGVLVFDHYISADGPGGLIADTRIEELINVDPVDVDPPPSELLMIADPFAPCDNNRDGRCDSQDLQLIDAAIGHCRDGDGYNEPADADHDGCVTAVDRGLLTAEDFDGDGRTDFLDACPSSTSSATVVIDGCDSGVANPMGSDGCTILDRINQCGLGATNHGAFQSCVAHTVKDLSLEGAAGDAIKSCAAQANIPAPAAP